LTKGDVIVTTEKTINSEDQAVFTLNVDIKAGATETFTVVASMNDVANKINKLAVVDVEANTNDVDGLPLV